MKYLKKYEVLTKKGYDDFVEIVKRGSSTKILSELKKGKNPNTIDPKTGNTALICACLGSFLFAVKILLEYGADPNLQNIRNGRTPLMSAVTYSIIKELLDAGANVNIQNSDGNNVAMDHETGTLDVLKLYIKQGLDLQIKNNKGENFYTIIRNRCEADRKRNGVSSRDEVLDYLHDLFPEYKLEYDMKKNMDMFNI